jgi:hypothetical protein
VLEKLHQLDRVVRRLARFFWILRQLTRQVRCLNRQTLNQRLEEGEMRLPWQGFLLASLACPAVQAGTTTGTCEATVGAWEYVAPTRGRSIVSHLGDKYTFVWFLMHGTPAASTSDPTTEAQKAAVYDNIGAGAAEFTCEGTGGKLRWKIRNLYNANPSAVGGTWTLDMELEGETARWWPVGSDGARGPMGTATRVK